ncbi:uncharacterized protein LOC124356215 [Homalodisca vitripennis]|uniref:uncharacterized protein LOC124356215 n=1 Tax=Homalodisca vitripennis TaxID=197043 RepID=UPI001EEA8A6E|nr:uncharacterized protein LOC124356215 [Homalodisca vitripennis]
MPQLKPNETTQLLTSDPELKTRKKYEFKNTSRSAKVAHQTVLSTRFGSSKNGNFSKNVEPTSNVTAPATKKIIPSLKNITRFSTLRSSNCLSHYMLCNPGSKVRNGGCCYGMICVKTSFANICLYYGWDYTRARKEHSDDILHYERVHKKTMKPRKKARKTKVMKE